MSVFRGTIFTGMVNPRRLGTAGMTLNLDLAYLVVRSSRVESVTLTRDCLG